MAAAGDSTHGLPPISRIADGKLREAALEWFAQREKPGFMEQRRPGKNKKQELPPIEAKKIDCLKWFYELCTKRIPEIIEQFLKEKNGILISEDDIYLFINNIYSGMLCNMQNLNRKDHFVFVRAFYIFKRVLWSFIIKEWNWLLFLTNEEVSSITIHFIQERINFIEKKIKRLEHPAIVEEKQRAVEQYLW